MIVENIIPRNVIINRGAAEVDNQISRDDIFNYHSSRKCNIYFIILNRTLDPFISEILLLLYRPIMDYGEGRSKVKIMNSLLLVGEPEIQKLEKWGRKVAEF